MVDRGGLENRCALAGTQGSNPCLSANLAENQPLTNEWGKIKGDALILGRFFFHLHEYLNFKIDLSSIKYYEYGYSMKKNQSFRLPIDLIERLKLLARKENRSLNNFVETVLLDAAYHQPYDTTLAAMKEVESGALRNDPAIDLSSISAMEKSKLEP